MRKSRRVSPATLSHLWLTNLLKHNGELGNINEWSGVDSFHSKFGVVPSLALFHLLLAVNHNLRSAAIRRNLAAKLHALAA